MTQGRTPYLDAFSTVSPIDLWFHYAVGALTEFNTIALVALFWSLIVIVGRPKAWLSASETTMLGAVTMIATLSFVPLQWCLDSSLFAGVCVALAFSTAHKVEGATSHLRACVYAVLTGLLAGFAVGVSPWLLPVVWALQISWIFTLHRSLRGSGWFGVRRTIYASLGSLIGFVTLVATIGGWLLVIEAWSALQLALESWMASGWITANRPPAQLAITALGTSLVLGCLAPGRKARVYGGASIITLSIILAITTGNGTSLLVGIPLLPMVWHRDDDNMKFPRLSAAVGAAGAVAAVLWIHISGIAHYQKGSEVFSHTGRTRVLERMAEIEGSGDGLVLTNHHEHELLMAGRRLPATPFLNGAVVSEAHKEERLRRLALNRVDQAHKNAPTWVVWNLKADDELESLEKNPTLAVWIRSNCVLAIPDEPGFLDPYDLYYCGLDRDRLR
jgi:hypothetical protein